MSALAFIRRCLAVGVDIETALLAGQIFEETTAAIAQRGSAEVREVCVYVISDAGGWVKVGVSDCPIARLAKLQTSNPRTLTLLYQSRGFARADAVKIERAAHLQLAHHDGSGEWFRCTASEAISAVQACGGGDE